MKRRTAIAAASALSVAVIAGALAIGANLGILGFQDSEKVGKLSPVSESSDVSSDPHVVTITTDVTDSPTPEASPSDDATPDDDADEVEIEDTPSPTSSPDDHDDGHDDGHDGPEDHETPEPDDD